jgi:serine/threonine-protein kinase HipA
VTAGAWRWAGSCTAGTISRGPTQCQSTPSSSSSRPGSTKRQHWEASSPHRDAGPDQWGRLLIERHADKQPLDELDYLLAAPDDRAGALGFGLGIRPPAPRRTFNQTIQLDRLQRIADALVAGEGVARSDEVVQADELLLIGTSMGGARPKVVVEDAEGLWLAKFNRKDDRWNVARVEHAMLALAASCGVSTAQSRVVEVAGRDVLLVKRFDRQRMAQGYSRARMVSALTLLRAGENATDRARWSYVLLAEELRRVCAAPRKEAPELFRRMCFNALISNTDDHPRNHAVIAPDRDWRLSPAYDLFPSTPVSLERRDLALVCGDLGRWANAQNLVSQAPRFLLERNSAAAIVEDMLGRVRSTWHSVARSHGVSERDCALIAGAFAYPGFEVPDLQHAGREIEARHRRTRKSERER